jgi:hypothetical protein
MGTNRLQKVKRLVLHLQVTPQQDVVNVKNQIFFVTFHVLLENVELLVASHTGFNVSKRFKIWQRVQTALNKIFIRENSLRVTIKSISTILELLLEFVKLLKIIYFKDELDQIFPLLIRHF